MVRRDESQTVQVGLRVKEPLRLALEESARQRGISMNAEIVRRLERSFERHDHVIEGAAIGGELYKTASELVSISRQLNNALRSSLLPGFTDEPSQYTEVKTRLDKLQGEVISINANLDSPSYRIIELLNYFYRPTWGIRWFIEKMVPSPSSAAPPRTKINERRSHPPARQDLVGAEI